MLRRLVYNLMHFDDVYHADVWIFLFSFIKSTLSTKDCGIQGMRVAIMNILAEVTRKLILFSNLYRYFINRPINMAFFKHRSWVSFFFDTHCISICLFMMYGVL